MRKLAILAGVAGASIMTLTVQYNQYRPRYHNPRPRGSSGPYRYSPSGGGIASHQGWRHFNGDWHNGCFNLSHLSDADACGSSSSGDGG
jgi:hypothetical protein